jgi:hypothetical protein
MKFEEMIKIITVLKKLMFRQYILDENGIPSDKPDYIGYDLTKQPMGFYDVNGDEYIFSIQDYLSEKWEIYEKEDTWFPVVYNLIYEGKHNDGIIEWFEKENDKFVTYKDFLKLKEILLEDMKMLNDEEFNYTEIECILNRRFNGE